MVGTYFIIVLTLFGLCFLKHVGLITPVPMDLFTFLMVFGICWLLHVALSIKHYIEWKRLLKRHNDKVDRILRPL